MTSSMLVAWPVLRLSCMPFCSRSSAVQIDVLPVSVGTAALLAYHLPLVKVHFLCSCSCQLPLSACLALDGLCGTPDVLRLPSLLGPRQLLSAQRRCTLCLSGLPARPPHSQLPLLAFLQVL